MNNKRGSVSVLLVFILSAMVGLTAIFVYAARQKAYSGICDGALNLAMRSVLSEYDIDLYENYGLMAFEKTGMSSALEINDYVDYSFKGKSPLSKTQVAFGDYSLGNLDTLKEQIIEYMKTNGAVYLAPEKADDHECSGYVNRTLRNKGVINGLPSKEYADGGSGFLDRVEQLKDQIESAENIFTETSNNYLMDKYILNHFRHGTGGAENNTSFFQHEVEYILSGNYSNYENLENVKKGLKVLRTALNTAYIYSDEKRYAQTLVAAELLSPASAPATQAIIITTWAAAEAGNDVKLLLKGKPVPLKKTDASWATSLDNVLNNASADYIDTGNDQGIYYSDYLMIFLHFQNEKVKLARVADLIQINMKVIQDRGFLMKTCNEGLYLTTEIYGKEHSYDTRY